MSIDHRHAKNSDEEPALGETPEAKHQGNHLALRDSSRGEDVMLQLLQNRQASVTGPQHPHIRVEDGTTSDHAGRTWAATMNQRVLVVLDLDGDQRLLRWLRRVLGGPPADLHLLSMRPPLDGVMAGEHRVAYAHQAEETVRAQTLASLRQVAARLKDEGFRVTTDVLFGEPGTTVLRVAAELRASLIVLAVREGRGWRRWRAGRMEHKILRGATVPVLAIRRHGQRVA
jgi:nucleotide-binding universal stress UspA family protein